MAANRRRKKLRTREVGKEDENKGYSLFMKTFTACRGEHYTPYDYHRHMQGQREMVGYNNFIRNGQTRHTLVPRALNVHPWEQYEEWKRQRSQHWQTPKTRHIKGH